MGDSSAEDLGRKVRQRPSTAADPSCVILRHVSGRSPCFLARRWIKDLDGDT